MVAEGSAPDSSLEKPLPDHSKTAKFGSHFSVPEIVVFGALILAFLLFLIHGWSAILFPYSLDYGEGPILDQTLRMSKFEGIYRSDLSSPPFTISNYPPLFSLVQVPLLWLFGPAFWYGRLISWLSIVAAAGCIGLTLHVLFRDRIAAFFGAMLLVAIPHVSCWAPLNRVDSLALGLSWAALLVIVRWPERRWSIVATALLLTAAVFTRQSYGLAAPMAAFFWLLSQRLRHRAFQLAGLVAILGSCVAILLNISTDGGFYFHIVRANVNEFKLNLLIFHLKNTATLFPFLILLSLTFIVVAVRKRMKAVWLISSYLVGSVMSALAIGKVGSNVNYMLELSAALSLAVGAFVAWKRSRSDSGDALRKRRRLKVTAALEVATVLLAVQVFMMSVSGSVMHAHVNSRQEHRAEAEAILREIQQSPGSVLVDEEMGMLPLAGMGLYLQPFEVTQLARAGVWDQTPLLRDIAKQRFSVIMIFKIPPPYPSPHWERWTPEMLNAIDRHYEEVDTIFLNHIYRPRK